MARTDRRHSTLSSVRRGALSVLLLTAVVVPAGPAAATAATPRTAQRYLYVDRPAGQTVEALAISPTGSAAPVPGTPYPSGAVTPPVFSIIAGSPNGRFVYTINFQNRSVSGFTVRPGGGLTPVPGSPFPTAGIAGSVVVSPDGRHAFVDAGSTIDSYAIRSDGSFVLPAYASAPADTFIDPTLGFAITTDGQIVPTGGVVPPNAAPTGHQLTVAPDGRHLFSSNFFSGTLTTYSLSPGGRIFTSSTITTVDKRPTYSGVTPNGRFLYIGSEDTNTVIGYAIAADGRLTLIPGAHVPVAPNAAPHPWTITADSKYLISNNPGSSSISSYAIASNGALTELPGSPYQLAYMPASASLTPDGTTLWVDELQTPPTATSQVHSFRVGSDGSLHALSDSPASAGLTFSDGPTTLITPDQGPTAVFSVRRSGRTALFNARASRDSDGHIARYDWNFGDGTVLRDGGPEPVHRFPTAGHYTTTLTVTDDEGCSYQFVTNGRSVACNGGPAARVSHRTQG